MCERKSRWAGDGNQRNRVEDRKMEARETQEKENQQSGQESERHEKEMRWTDTHTHAHTHTHTHSYTHMHIHAHTHTRSHTHTLTHTQIRDRKRQTEQDILSDKGQAMCPQWRRNRLAGWVRDIRASLHPCPLDPVRVCANQPAGSRYTAASPSAPEASKALSLRLDSKLTVSTASHASCRGPPAPRAR